jgi:natural product precursor
MKKQTKKLMLNKQTISNLNPSEMSRLVGGAVSELFEGWL